MTIFSILKLIKAQINPATMRSVNNKLPLSITGAKYLASENPNAKKATAKTNLRILSPKKQDKKPTIAITKIKSELKLLSFPSLFLA